MMDFKEGDKVRIIEEGHFLDQTEGIVGYVNGDVITVMIPKDSIPFELRKKFFVGSHGYVPVACQRSELEHYGSKIIL